MKNWMTILLVTTFLVLTAMSQAEACYTAREQEAEQGVRIHSELMVIGLTCARMPNGQELYRKYQNFTVKNSHLIAGYESDLISYYARQGARAPEEKFHTLRTNIANEISRRAVNMSTLTFCNRFSSHIDQALAMDQKKLRRWAQHYWPDQPLSEPACGRAGRRT